MRKAVLLLPSLALLALLAPTATAVAQGVRDTTRRGDSVTTRDSPLPAHRRSRPIRVCAGGDVTLGTNLDTLWQKRARTRLRADFGLSDSPDSLLLPIQPLLSGADLVMLNVEGAIGDGPVRESKCGRRAEHCYAFRQPTATAGALRRLVSDSVVVVGNVANNHAHDAGDQGLRATIAALRRAGVLVTGADTLATPVVVPGGDTIAIIGFHTSSEAPDARDLAAVRRHVERAAEQYGTVIVTMHLGAEGANAQRTRDSTELFLGSIDRGNPVAFADTALAAGATMVIGHGPHVLRAAEFRDRRLVLYSLGNLLTYGPFRLAEPMNRGGIACATIDSVGVVSAVVLESTMQLAPGVLRVDSTGRAATLMDSLSALDFPSTGARVVAMDSSNASEPPRPGEVALVPPPGGARTDVAAPAEARLMRDSLALPRKRPREDRRRR